MRDAAANLEFEDAARLRDEIQRLRATELAVMDDPLARSHIVTAEASWPKGGKARKKGARGRSSGGKPGTRTYRGKGR